MKALTVLVSLAAIAAVSGALFVYFGVYDVSATNQHTRPVHWLLDITMRRAVQARAHDIPVPALDGQAQIERGLRLYEANCEICHGGPGVAPDAIALGLTPVPANLAHTARVWRPSELFWVVKHGIKMSGMPGWKFRLPEDDIWAIVAFLRTLPAMTPLEYQAAVQAFAGIPAEVVSKPQAAQAGDAERGKNAIQQHACVTCHEIPGIVGSGAPVGPTLAGIASRQFLAGVLPNTPENMVRWLREPTTIDPRTAMPDLRVSERDARDIAAYLYTLE